jgi:hypothetical protein
MIEPATHATGYRRDTAAIVTVRLATGEVDTLTHVPTIEWVQRIQSDGGRVSIGLPFAYSAIIMRWKRGYLIATREGYEFRRIRPDGNLDLIVRRSDSPLVSVSKAMRDRWLDSAQTAEKKEPPTETEFPSPKELIDAVPTNRALWAHGSIHVDGLERVWVEDFRPQQTVADSAFGHWTVFDSSGVAIARATLPRSLTIRHIAADHIVATVRDSLEVEFVVVRAIKR